MISPRSLTLAVALALLAANCSSGDNASTATTAAPATTVTIEAPTTTTAPAPTTTAAPTTTTAPAPTTTTAPATTTTTAPEETGDAILTDAQLADRELAKSALITIDLFPDGWIEQPDDDETDDDGIADEEFEADFNACLDRSDEERVGDDLEPLTVSTGDFMPVDDLATSVSHEVRLAPDEATAITAMAEVQFDGAESCLADVVQRFYAATFADDPDLADIEIGAVLVTRPELAEAPDIGVGVVVEIPLTIGTETLSQFLEILYQRRGRALSKLSFSSFGRRFDEAGYTVLGDEVAVRLTGIGS